MALVPRVKMSPDGPVFSRLVQGYWRMDKWNMSPQKRLSFIKQHVEMGITTVDHAYVYGSPSCESLFGEALRICPTLRETIEIVSKCGISPAGIANNGKHVDHYNLCKNTILSSVDASLLRLEVEYLDVLLIHRPDRLMDADEVAEAFHQLSQNGKVKYFGVSNFTPSQLSLLQSRLDVPIVTNQVEINPVNMNVIEDGTLDQLQQKRVRPMAWSCLAGGRIFGEQTTKLERLRSTLTALAEELGARSIEQVIYAWVMKIPSNPVPILGSGDISRISSAVESLSLTLNHEQWYRVWVASQGRNVP